MLQNIYVMMGHQQSVPAPDTVADKCVNVLLECKQKNDLLPLFEFLNFGLIWKKLVETGINPDGTDSEDSYFAPKGWRIPIDKL
jgi:hypothetical protein